MSGYFFNFEGVDGSGKSIQVRLLHERLLSLGKDVILTREPGGTPYAEKIRELTQLKDVPEEIFSMTDVLLFNASRYQHVKAVIEPALKRGAIVLCDRFLPSTIAYQGAKGGVSKDRVEAIHNEIFGDFRPDLNIVVDTDTDVAYLRVSSRSNQDRFELALRDTKHFIRNSYLQQALEKPGEFVVIDGSFSIEEIHTKILDIVLSKIGN